MAEALSAAEVIEASDGHVRLRLPRHFDVGATVALARQSADIVSFSYQPPTLSELFRQAVAA